MAPAITAETTAAIGRFRERVKTNSQHFVSLEDWLTDHTLQRFLIARKYDENAAFALIEKAIEWRMKRQPHKFEQTTGWKERMKHESETGKIYIPGHDKYGRPVIIFDNTVQNTKDVDENMVFLSWNLEFATRLMAPNIDKYVVFMHLYNFSMWNVPPMASTTETIHMLCNCYPERLGHIICYLPPFYFNVFYQTIWYLLDEKTAAKVVFISGSAEEGSENDLKLKEIIGDNWRELTGADQPVLSLYGSPGYNHDAYWATVSTRLDTLAAAAGKNK